MVFYSYLEEPSDKITRPLVTYSHGSIELSYPLSIKYKVSLPVRYQMGMIPFTRQSALVISIKNPDIKD